MQIYSTSIHNTLSLCNWIKRYIFGLPPRVTVIIPVYNVEAYLHECLDSVLHQTLKDIEIICVNDGSTDNSPTILAEYAAQDRRITVIHKTDNNGLSSARNTGLSTAHGKFIYFLDSDDFILPDTLERLTAQAERDSLDMLMFDASTLFEEDLLLEHKNMFKRYTYLRTHQYPEICSGIKLFSRMHAQSEYRCPVYLYLLRRSFLNKYSITFYENIIHEDNLFTFQCCVKAERAGYASLQGCIRRIRENSIMTTPAGCLNFKGYFICLLQMLREIEGKDYPSDVENEIIKLFQELLHEINQLFPKLKTYDLILIFQNESLFIRTLLDIYLQLQRSSNRSSQHCQ